MKITITKEFDSVEDAQAFLNLVVGSAPAVAQAQEAQSTELPAPTTATLADAPRSTTEQPVAKRTRQPRSDAGKPRGPHKNTEVTQGGSPLSETTGATATGGAALPASVPAAPEEPKSVAAGQSAPLAPAAATHTPADALAALKRISEEPGLGMDACMAHLAVFSVIRISDVKPDQYAEFIKQADAKVAAHRAAKAAKK